MAIIYTYPKKQTPNDDDLLIISDSQDSNKTKRIKISSLPGGSAAGVASLSTALPLLDTGGSTPAISISGLSGYGTSGQIMQMNSSGNALEWGTITGAQLAIENEGSQLTSAATKINFTGSGVTATNSSGDVTVNIPDAFVIEDVQLASAVSKGDALYISGPAHGSGRPTVDIADATNATKMPVIGLALADYAAGQGKVLVTGILDDVNLNSVPFSTNGAILYVDTSGTTGNITGTKPTGTALIQNVAIVTKSGANGALQVSCIGRTNDLPNVPQGSIFIGNSNGVASNLGIGANATVLTSNGSTATWSTLPADTNIANTELTLGANRTLSQSTYTLTFTGSGLTSFNSTAGVKVEKNLQIADGQAYVDIEDLGSISGNQIIALNSGNVQKLTLSGNLNIVDFTNIKQGATYILMIQQPSSGSYQVSNWSSKVKFPGGSAPTLSSNGAVDVITLVAYSSTVMLGASSLNYTV